MRGPLGETAFARAPRVRGAVLLGLACGVAALTRTELTLLFPLLVLPLVLRSRGSDLRSRLRMLVAAGVVLRTIEGRLVERVCADQVTPYPPGIPLLIPGERFNATIVRYLKFTRAFNEKFPGFETDVHGLVKDRQNGATRYYVDCVA